MWCKSVLFSETVAINPPKVLNTTRSTYYRIADSADELSQNQMLAPTPALLRWIRLLRFVLRSFNIQTTRQLTKH